MKTENKWTKLLFKELESAEPSEKRIRALFEQGANIKGEFLWDLILYHVQQPPCGNSLPFKYVELLINLGAEVNFCQEGYNSLWPASVCIRNSALVELLLRMGADANCYSKEDQSTILSAVIFDEREGETTEQETEELFKCMELLKKYGAKTNREIAEPRRTGEKV